MSSDLNVQQMQLVAYAVFTCATAAVIKARGCSIARTALGTYTCTLDGSAGDTDATECIVVANCRGATPAILSSVQTSDSVKTLYAVDATGAAVDPTEMSVLVYRLA